MFGIAHHRIPAATTGAGYATLMPGYLAGLLDGYPDGDVTVKLGTLPSEPVEVSRRRVDRFRRPPSTRTATGSPTANSSSSTRSARMPQTAAVAASTCSRTEPLVHGRFADGPPRLEMSTVVLAGVEASAELLAELNDHNRHLGLARVALDGSDVVMQADLLVSSLDEAELRTTAAWIGEQTRGSWRRSSPPCSAAPTPTGAPKSPVDHPPRPRPIA